MTIQEILKLYNIEECDETYEFILDILCEDPYISNERFIKYLKEFHKNREFNKKLNKLIR